MLFLNQYKFLMSLFNRVKFPFVVALCIVFLKPSWSIGQNTISTTDINTINTAVPFLKIAPDARSGAMGDVGIALSDDVNSTYWNPAKLAFAKKDMGVGITYTPWLRALGITDIYLAHVSAYKKVGKNQAIGTSLRYFSLGDIQFTNYQGDPIGNFSPRELAFDVDYSRLLSKHFAVSIALRYIYSNLASGQTVNGVQVNAANGVAADFSTYYKKDVKFGSTKALWSLGTSMTNLGTKMTYTKTATNKDYLPANLGIGTAMKFDVDKFNTVEVALDCNKLLVPTPNPNDPTLAYQNKSPISGALGSFNDAPGGLKEEIKEVYYSLGAEYWYNSQFAVRSGVFYEDPTKGNRKYLTVGIGVKYSVLCLNFSYLVPVNKGTQKSPLDNTLRFSLIFDFQNMEKGNNNAATF
jgi:Type IX secretion system protein PorV